MNKLFLTVATTSAIALSSLFSAATQAADYKIDTAGAHAAIQFKIKHLGYSWLLGRFNTFDGNFSYDQTPTHTYPKDGNYIVKLDITTNKGCTGSASKVFVVYPNPVAKFTTKNTCAGTVADFVSQSYVAQGSVVSHHWAFRDATYSTDQHPSHTYAGDQVYNVLLTVTSDQGCTGSVENPIIIWPVPVADFTTDAVCDGFCGLGSV